MQLILKNNFLISLTFKKKKKCLLSTPLLLFMNIRNILLLEKLTNKISEVRLSV